MKKFRIIAAVLLILSLLGSTALARESIVMSMYVDGKNASKVHLRQEPSTSAKSLGLLYTGTEVTPISSTVAGWMQVQIGAETGYISTTYLTEVQPQSKAPVALVSNPNSNWAHLRQGAGRQNQSIGRLYNGNTVYVLGEMASGWSYVRNGDQVGFVVSSFLKSAASSSVSTAGTKKLLSNPSLQVVGYTAQADMIYCLKAPDNGQALYFVSMEKSPAVYWDDVNFDGLNDLVVTTSSGANNQFSMFFVRNSTGYVPVQVSGLDNGLCNYTLYPQQKLVLSYANNSSAGACHEYALLQWNGATLKVIRRAVSDLLVEQYMQNGASITSTSSQLLKVTVRDYTSSFNGGFVMFETTVSTGNTGTAFAQEQTALWEGLK